MTTQIKDFFRNKEGAETLEYVVIVAIIIVIGAGIYNTQLGSVIQAAFSSITSAIGAVTGP